MAGLQTLRKAIIIIGMSMGISMEVFVFGHGVSMVTALYSDKDDLKLSHDIISWIMSIVYTPMVFGTIAATVFTERFGRRLTIAVFNFPIVLYWIILYYVRDGNILIISRLMVGFCFGATMPIIYMTLVECSSPNMRGTYMAFVSAMAPIGGTLGEVLALAFHWRPVALGAVVPTALAAILPLFFVESPQWLASKGRFDESEKAFRALHGDNQSSDKELQLLLEVERSKCNKDDTKTQRILLLLKRLKEAARKKYFWNMILLDAVSQIYKLFSGNVLKGMLGPTITQNITGQSDVLKFTILIDGLMLLGSGLSSVLMGKCNNKTYLFIGGIANILILIILSILLFLKSNNDLVFPWFSAFVFGMHCLFVNGLFPLIGMISQEIYPLEIKTGCTTIISFVSTMGMFAYGKAIGSMLIQINYQGVYLLSAVIMSFCLLFYWYKLPETRGRTLQEIELFFKNNKFVNIDEVLNADQIKELL